MQPYPIAWIILTLVLTTLPCPSNLSATEHTAIEQSFQTFCRGWLDASHKYNDKALAWQHINGAYEATFTKCSSDYQFYVKKTESAAAPFIGVLKYREYNCVASTPCLNQQSNHLVRVVDECPVTEIFMFKNGQWQY